MQLNPDICYQAVQAHDARFDGAFFTAVKTTKIYCRTVCTAKTPMLQNCTFFATAAAAERQGYRPCLRCRPELAPGNSPVDSVSRLAAIAFNRIEDGALSQSGVDALANEMGITSRHLRRVIESEFGATPIELAQTQRLLLAKRLLTDTDLPVTEIAFASGFSSVRRFNALFLSRYRLNPTQLRKRITSRITSGKPEMLTCEIAYRPPFDWDTLLSFLAARACSGIESVSENQYMRTACFGKNSGWIIVNNNEHKNTLTIQLTNSLAPSLLQVVARCKRLFDTQADPLVIAHHLGALGRQNPGLRVPGAFNGFEIAVRAILGQQVSVKAATTLAGRFAAAFGQSIETPFAALHKLSPAPDVVAQLKPAQLVALGITNARALSIVSLAAAVVEGRLSLEPGGNVEKNTGALRDLPGVGDWTAQYVAMRALSWPDAFLQCDLGIKKALALTSEKQILNIAEQWRPWRAYASMHLWKSLEKSNDSLLSLPGEPVR